MRIPPAVDGTQPAICGCKLDCIYMANQLHMHWGSPSELGSEHMLGCSRYHGELHVVHMNSAYESVKEAIHEPDGFLVLAVLLRVVCVSWNPIYKKRIGSTILVYYLVSRDETALLRRDLQKRGSCKKYEYDCNYRCSCHIKRHPGIVGRRKGKVFHLPGSANTYYVSTSVSLGFLFFVGSLTTPPCAEVVTWFVFTKPVEVLLTFVSILITINYI